MTCRVAGRLLMGAAILLMCSQCTPPPPATEVPEKIVAQLGSASALLPLYQALDELQAGRAKAPVAILQVGDSHTANDGFSGRMRELFQAKFGDAGRGMLPPGIPYKYYRPSQVTVTASGWRVISSLDPSTSGPFGISGLRQSATGSAAMTLSADDPGGATQTWVEALGRPGGGTVVASLDSGPAVSFSTSAAGPGPLWLKMPTAPGFATLTVSARGDGPVDLLSWTVLRDQPGVTWSNLGTISATVDLIGRWDPALLDAEMARLQPALILVAFGTNEGFRDSTDIAEYAGLYAQRVGALHKAAPHAAILVMGPPDGNRRAARGMASAAACPPPTDGPPERVVWTIPPRLAEVREVQRRFAQQAGYYYWDWSAAMGGACSMQAMARTDPPQGAPDHVHMFAPGYRATAQLLFDEIMRGYTRYQALMHPR